MGKPTYKYVVIEKKCNQDGRTAYICSCDIANCIHVGELPLVLDIYSPGTDDDTLIEEKKYIHLTPKLISVYCDRDESYSILSHSEMQVKCLKCQDKVTACLHVRVFTEYGGKNADPVAEPRLPKIFSAISTDPIPYTLETDKDIEIAQGYIGSDRPYPKELIPEFKEDLVCKHGNKFDKDVTVEMPKAKLHLPFISKAVSIYYRPAKDLVCECKQFYSGRDDLLLNLDNLHVFPWVWLFDILHDVQSTHTTLYGQCSSKNLTRGAFNTQPLQASMYNKLRLAYNCFIRLLDLPYHELFKCEKCGPNVKQVVLDAIQMGGKKKQFKKIKRRSANNRSIKGSTIDQQLFIRDPNTRNLLKKMQMLVNTTNTMPL